MVEIFTELRPEILGAILTHISSTAFERIFIDDQLKRKLAHRKNSLLSNLQQQLSTISDNIDWDKPEVHLLLLSKDTVKIVSQLWRLSSDSPAPAQIKQQFIEQLADEFNEPIEQVYSIASNLFDHILNAYTDYIYSLIDQNSIASALDGQSTRRFQIAEEKRLAAQRDTQNRLDDIARIGLGNHDKLENLSMQIPVYTSLSSEIMSEYKAQIDVGQEFVELLNPDQALRHLNKLEKRIWDKLAHSERYRLLVNKALAHHYKEENKKAAELFIKAHLLNQKDSKAISNAAFGYLLRKEYAQATKLANRALSLDPTLTHAYAVRIWSQRDAESFQDVVDSVPSVLRSDVNIASALGGLASIKGLFSEATRWLRVACLPENNAHPDTIARLATVLMQSIQQVPSLIKRTIEQSALEIEALYKRVLELTEDNDIQRYRPEWFVNLATVQMWCGKVNEARDNLDYAMKLAPSDLNIVRNRAVLAYGTEDYRRAKQLFTDLRANPEYRKDSQFFLTLIAFANEEFSSVEELATETLVNCGELYCVWDTARVLIVAKLRLKKPDDAEAVVEGLTKEYPDEIYPLVLKALIHRERGQTEAAKELLQSVANRFTEDTDPSSKFATCQEMRELEMYAETIPILESITDTRLDTPPTYQLIYAYYYNGNLDLALQICNTLKDKYGILKHVATIEIAIYEEVDELELAKATCLDYLAQYPSSPELELRLAVLNYRLKDFDGVDNYLATHTNQSQLSLPQAGQYVNLLIERELGMEALDYAYEVLHRFPNEPEAHLLYAIRTLFHADKLIPKEKLTPSVVEDNTTVCLVEIDGSEPQWFTIEDSERDTNLYGVKMTRHDELAKRLMGSQVGDIVQIQDQPFPRSKKLSEIKSKYIHAFHQITKTFNIRFPFADGFWSFKPEMDETDPAVFEQSIMGFIDSIVGARETRVMTTSDAIGIENMSVGFISHQSGRSIIESMAIASANPETGILCCFGISDERQTALSELNACSELILDTTAILSVCQMGLEEILPENFSLYVVRSTVNEFEGFIRSFPAHSASLYSSIKPFFLDSNGKAQVDFSSIKKIIKWVEGNCTILPNTAALSVSRNERNELGRLFGFSALDTSLAASERAILLYSDDRNLRAYSMDSSERIGAWTQTIAIYLYQEGKITEDKYNQIVTDLIDLNYRHTSVNASGLFVMAVRSEWELSFELQKGLQTIEGVKVDPSSSFALLTEFTYLLWEQNISYEKALTLTLKILDTLTTGRPVEDRYKLLNSFEHWIVEFFADDSYMQGKIHSIVRTWRYLSKLL